MDSPCVKICVISPATGLCAGCGRTLAEIGNWTRLTNEERRRIMADLARRLSPADDDAKG